MKLPADKIDELVAAVSALDEATITVTIYLSTVAGTINRQVTAAVRFSMTVILVGKRTNDQWLVADGAEDATLEIALAQVTNFVHLHDARLERIEITEGYEQGMERRIYIQKKMNEG